MKYLRNDTMGYNNMDIEKYINKLYIIYLDIKREVGSRSPYL